LTAVSIDSTEVAQRVGRSADASTRRCLVIGRGWPVRSMRTGHPDQRVVPAFPRNRDDRLDDLLLMEMRAAARL